MAKNWTAAEAVGVLVKGEDKAAIQDIGRRFPLFATAASRGQVGLVEIIESLPELITTRKVEGIFKEGIEETDEEEDKPVQKKEAPVKKSKGKGKKKAKPEPVEDEDEEEEEEWDEEEEEVEEKPKKTKPKTKSKGAGKPSSKGKSKKKPKPDTEEDDEDDEDWDL